MLKAIKQTQNKNTTTSYQSQTSPTIKLEQKPITKQTKQRLKHEQRVRKRPVLDTNMLSTLKDIVRDIRDAVKEAYLSGIEEGFRRAREPNEENIIISIWNSEPSGVKLSNLVLIFGRENSNKIQRILLHLEQKGVLMRDRNRWWHINPRRIENILREYGIEFTFEEVMVIRQRLKNRFNGVIQ